MSKNSLLVSKEDFETFYLEPQSWFKRMKSFGNAEKNSVGSFQMLLYFVKV